MSLVIKKSKKKNELSEEKRFLGVCMLTISKSEDGEIAESLKNRGNTLIAEAFAWILQHKRNYRYAGTKAKKLTKKIKKLKYRFDMKLSGYSEGIGLLKEFHDCFLTNPLLYENKVKPTDGSYVTTARVDCYFVAVETTQQELLYVPIGCLKKFLTEEQVKKITKRFVENCKEHRNEFFGAFKSLRAKNTGETKRNLMTRSQLRFLVAVLVVGLWFVADWLIKTEWSRFFFWDKLPANLLYPIYWASTHRYGIELVSSLNVVLFLLPIWCMVRCLCALGFLISDCRTRYAMGVNKKKHAAIKALTELTGGVLTSGWDDVENAIDGIVQQRKGVSIEKLIRIATSEKNNTDYADAPKTMGAGNPSVAQNTIYRVNTTIETPKTDEVSNHTGKYAKKAAAKTKRRKRMHVSLAATVLLCLALTWAATKPAVQKAYDQAACFVNQTVHALGNSVRTPGTTTTGLSVWAKPSAENLLLYQLPAPAVYTVIEEHKPVEGYKKIKFQTACGYRTGWVDAAAMESYDPNLDASLCYIPPAFYDASNLSWIDQLLHAPKKVSDFRLGSAWLCSSDGGGVGEALTMGLYAEDEEEKTHLIQVIGIATGDGSSAETFAKNGCPTEIKIEFITDGEVTKTITTALEDTYRMQYFRYNKPISADSVRFIVSKIRVGSKHAETYISEIHLFESTVAAMETVE